jgi:hypothetical protein
VKSLGRLSPSGATLAAVLPALLPSPAPAAPAVDLLPHRAAYRLSLLEADDAAGLSDVRGGLVLEWRAACDGWLSQQRLGFVAQADEGPGFTYDVRFSSWEARDRTAMRFNVRSFDGERLEEEYRGQAQLEGPGGGGTVRYAVPEGEEASLPVGTVFPTQHVQDLIAAARAGERFVAREVFDGSGEDALTLATAVIGPAREVTLPAGGGSERRWPVGLAYFPVAVGGDALPEFEIGFTLTEGGVFHDVTLDYGDFRLKAELEKLEPLDRPACD